MQKEGKRKIIIPAIAVSVLLLTLILTSVLSFSSLSSISSVPASSQGSKLKSVWCFDVLRADGSQESYGCKDNIVYNDGLNRTIDDIVGLGNANFLENI